MQVESDHKQGFGIVIFDADVEQRQISSLGSGERHFLKKLRSQPRMYEPWIVTLKSQMTKKHDKKD